MGVGARLAAVLAYASEVRRPRLAAAMLRAGWSACLVVGAGRAMALRRRREVAMGRCCGWGRLRTLETRRGEATGWNCGAALLDCGLIDVGVKVCGVAVGSLPGATSDR